MIITLLLMKSFFKFIKKNWFFTAVYITLLLAFIFRIYNLQERVNIGSDHVRDVIIAQEALKRGELPLIGSFASAGPFVFGPLYYWFVMVALTILPFSFKSPWLLMTFIGFLTVVIMMRTGFLIGGRRLCIIIGLLAAFSPQFIARSTFLSQHSLVGITTALSVLFFVLLYQRKKPLFSFLIGLSVGAAVSMHYQAINLLIFLPAMLLIPKTTIKMKAVYFLLFSIGFIVPMIPLTYWDAQQNFANYNNILDYIFIAQYRIYVANSWKLYLLQYLPDYWSNVVGGNKPVAFIIMVVTFLTFVIQFLRRKLPGEILMLGAIFGILLIVIRYYKGERFDGYMIYTAPFIFVVCAWTFLTLFDVIRNSHVIKHASHKSQKAFISVSLVILIIILGFDFKNASQFIFMDSTHEEHIILAKNALIKKFPNEKFQLYDYFWKGSNYSYYLGVLLEKEGKISKDGMPIGVAYPYFPYSSEIKPIYNGIWTVTPLTNLSPELLEKPLWSKANPSDVYDDLMKWQKGEKLTSSFSLPNYVMERLGLRER